MTDTVCLVAIRRTTLNFLPCEAFNFKLKDSWADGSFIFFGIFNK